LNENHGNPTTREAMPKGIRLAMSFATALSDIVVYQFKHCRYLT